MVAAGSPVSDLGEGLFLDEAAVKILSGEPMANIPVNHILISKTYCYCCLTLYLPVTELLDFLSL
jgi:hypothetical protein